MNKEDIITLEDNTEYLILDIIELNHEKYMYCVEINELELPTDNYAYFKEIKEQNDIYIEEVKDEKTLKNIISLFTNDYLNDSINTNEEQDV